MAKKIKSYTHGIAYEYPSFIIKNGHLAIKEPIANLIAAPKILVNKDPELIKNIDYLWTFLAKRLEDESNGKIDLKKKSILNAIYGHWNLNPKSKRELENRQLNEIEKLTA